MSEESKNGEYLTASTNGSTHCVCGARLIWPQPFGVVGWLWRVNMDARAKAHAACGGGR